jgi:hypothetical protein
LYGFVGVGLPQPLWLASVSSNGVGIATVLESVLKISDRDPNGFAGKPQSMSGRLAAPLVNPLRQKNL